MTESLSSSLSWCPLGMGMKDLDGNITLSPLPQDNSAEDDENALPEIEHPSHLNCLYLPMEDILVRKFHFPLKHPKYLDAPMLAQELADTAGIEPDDWWLSWHADKSGQGISGIAFGLPKTQKKYIQSIPAWQQSQFILIDGWARLNALLPVAEETPEALAIIDIDAEGIFFGFHQLGIWQGMRRLNADMQEALSISVATKEMLRSLQSMGFDTESMPMVGQITQAMSESLQNIQSTSALHITETPEPRHIRNLTLEAPNKNNALLLNIRHGKWALKKKSAVPKVWVRPILMAACLCLVWLSATVWNNIQLENQLATMQEDITAAFHRGLPNQTVIIDAMAQLRQASGQGSGSTTGGNNQITQQLNFIGATFKTHPWEMRELKVDSKGISISGTVKNLETLNTIRSNLSKNTGANVQVADTDLSDDKVAFRIHWL